MKLQINILFLLNLTIRLRIAVGETKDEYLQRRAAFISEEKMGFIGGYIKLTDDELKVNSHLMKLKLAEINVGRKNESLFAPASHFFRAKPLIDNSPVFKLIRKMPKGGVLHIHDMAIVDINWLIRRATYDPHCYMCVNNNLLQFKFFSKPPTHNTGCRWQQVIKARSQHADPQVFDQSLYASMTMTEDDPDKAYKTQDAAWVRFLSLFGTISGLFSYAPIFQDYCYEALTEFYNDNVQYMEIRVLLPETYELNGTVHDSDWAMDAYERCFKKFRLNHPDFSGARVILTSIRSLNKTDISGDIKKAIRYKQKYPAIFAGYDLVSQEDQGHSLYYFLDELLAATQGDSHLRYFFHAGETDWEGISVDENLIDAILLNTTRIGHAYAITKHPKVMAKVMEKGIALEINPISNQVLKLVSDLRDHPAASLLAQDYPLVISSDDPALWGATGLSHDFYETLMGIGGAWTDLKTLKKLIINSICHSAMTTVEKTTALKIWALKWADFINDTIRSHDL